MVISSLRYHCRLGVNDVHAWSHRQSCASIGQNPAHDNAFLASHRPVTSMQATTNPFSTYDVVVIGAGHAGCEAALAAARAGCRTLVVTPNLDRIGFMPCNPSMGGPGKSQIIAEIDALGGAMGRIADMTAVQARELNTSKGPAVRAVRLQCDKSLYAI